MHHRVVFTHRAKHASKFLKFCWHFINDVFYSKYIKERSGGGATTSTACLVPYSTKQFTMEPNSKERKQRNCNTFLMVFVAVTFTLALLEGAGLVISYTSIAVLESCVLGLRSGVPTVPSTDGSPGESPGMKEVLSACFI